MEPAASATTHSMAMHVPITSPLGAEANSTISPPTQSERWQPVLAATLFDSTAAGQGVSYVEMLKQVAVAAAKQDMLIVLAAGRLTPTSWPGEGLWYSREIPESVLLQQWTKLADALCGQWNVVAVDLHHEPHKATNTHLGRPVLSVASRVHRVLPVVR